MLCKGVGLKHAVEAKVISSLIDSLSPLRLSLSDPDLTRVRLTDGGPRPPEQRSLGGWGCHEARLLRIFSVFTSVTPGHTVPCC